MGDKSEAHQSFMDMDSYCESEGNVDCSELTDAKKKS